MGERAEALLVTLCVLRCGRRLLLLRPSAARDRFRGLWNGIGGHVRPGEDIRAAARREVREESGLDPEDLRLRAVLHETGLLGRTHVLFVFTGELAAAGPVAPGPEGELAWFDQGELPWEDLVPDLRVLLPRLFETREVRFGVQQFDGSDRALRLEIG